MNPENILRIISKHGGRRGEIISILEDIQAEYTFLPADALRIVAKKTERSLVDLYGVATFFKCFSLEPRGKHLVSVCTGTACHVRGAPRIVESFEEKIGVAPGQTTDDREFTLTTVNCLGACALGPVAVIDGEYHRNVKRHEVSEIVDAATQDLGADLSDDERIFRINASCPQCNRSLMTDEHMLEGHPMIHVTASFGRKHGWLRMSGLYGDYRIESEYEIPTDTVVDFFCPKCHAELHSTRICPRCDAPMMPLFVKGGGMMRICSRRGCKEHMLDMSA